MLGGTELIARYFREARRFSTEDVVFIMPWLVKAGSEGIDNDPGKRGPAEGLEIVEEAERICDQGVQRGMQYKIYVLRYKR